MSDKKHSVKRTVFGGVFSIAILAFAVFLLLNQQYVKDQVTYWSFQPTQNVQALEGNIDFTPTGKFYFYAQQPQIDGSDAFNTSCQRQEVGNPILGCYTTGRIYVYDVTNEQLDGIEEVTAAHETLHAVWDRMSENEQAKLGALLEAEYAKLSNNSDLVQRMEYYKRTEPGQLDNELHSILGTEIQSLSPALEAHYAKYFSNRQKIIDFHMKYATIFSNLKSQSDSLYAELTALGANIESRSGTYDADVTQLSADISSFNTRADNGDFSSINQFKNERAVLLARSNRLDAERASISADIDAYNEKYKEYQKVSSAIEVLNKSIDSIKELQPTPSV